MRVTPEDTGEDFPYPVKGTIVEDDQSEIPPTPLTDKGKLENIEEEEAAGPSTNDSDSHGLIKKLKKTATSLLGGESKQRTRKQTTKLQVDPSKLSFQ